MNNHYHPQNQNTPDKCALYKAICEISFTIDELRLYLDVHPENENALSMISDCMKKRHALVAEYTANFGPIYSYYVDTSGGWSWIDDPMPWKGRV